MNKLISTFELECRGYIGGITEIWIMNRSDLGEWRYQPDTNYPFQLYRISGNTVFACSLPADKKFKRLEVDRKFSKYREAQENKQTLRTFRQILELRVWANEPSVRNTLEQMAVSDEVVVIFRAKDSKKYYITGVTRGCKLTSWTTTNTDEGQEVLFTLETVERFPLKELSTTTNLLGDCTPIED